MDGGIDAMLPRQPVPSSASGYSQPMAGMDPRLVVIAEAEDALTGQSQDPNGALQRFVDMFGEAALHQLRQQVARGQTLRGLQEDQQSGAGRLLQGPGDGTSDSIPAVIDGRQPTSLSTGEYVMPAAAVAGAGGGDVGQGASRLDELSRMLASRR